LPHPAQYSRAVDMVNRSWISEESPSWEAPDVPLLDHAKWWTCYYEVSCLCKTALESAWPHRPR
jgi:hypothetical protein